MQEVLVLPMHTAQVLQWHIAQVLVLLHTGLAPQLQRTGLALRLQCTGGSIALPWARQQQLRHALVHRKEETLTWLC
jgi:hypothetical protein